MPLLRCSAVGCEPGGGLLRVCVEVYECMEKKYKYILWDLDGTLTDSALGILRTAAYALRHFGIQVDDLRQLRPFVGPPLEDSFMEFYGFSATQAQEAVEIYRGRYEKIGVRENAPYPGVHECLQRLRERGYTLMLATSKPENTARTVLKEFELEGFFDFVCGRDAEGRLHSKADVLRHILETTGIGGEKERAVMVGDRKYDILGAKEVGIDAVGVLFGYGSREELSGAGASWLVEDYEGVLELFP